VVVVVVVVVVAVVIVVVLVAHAVFVLIIATIITRWLYCVECRQYSTRLEELGYLYVSSNAMSPALRPTSYLRTKWHVNQSSPLATIGTGRKLGGGCCAPYGGAGFLSLRPFFWDHPGEPVPEQNFWTLWCKGR